MIPGSTDVRLQAIQKTNSVPEDYATLSLASANTWNFSNGEKYEKKSQHVG